LDQTALHVSVTAGPTAGHTAVTRVLLEGGFDPNHRDSNGYTPLFKAAKDEKIDMARLLLEHGADPNSMANPLYGVNRPLGRPLGSISWQLCSTELIYYKGGDTPLKQAAVEGQFNSASLLLKHGAEVDFKGYSGITPLWLAAKYGHEDIVRLLLSKAAGANAYDASKSTVLSEATKARHEGTVRPSVDKRASMIPVDGESTPLPLASRWVTELADRNRHSVGYRAL
jgi:ankyrin